MKKVVVKASQYDADGIEIQFLNNRKRQIVKVCPGSCMRPLRAWPDVGGRRRRMLQSYSRTSDRIWAPRLVLV
jgi:hypothetical protein